jgi:hypothetical protein
MFNIPLLLAIEANTQLKVGICSDYGSDCRADHFSNCKLVTCDL